MACTSCSGIGPTAASSAHGWGLAGAGGAAAPVYMWRTAHTAAQQPPHCHPPPLPLLQVPGSTDVFTFAPTSVVGELLSTCEGAGWPPASAPPAVAELCTCAALMSSSPPPTHGSIEAGTAPIDALTALGTLFPYDYDYLFNFQGGAALNGISTLNRVRPAGAASAAGTLGLRGRAAEWEGRVRLVRSLLRLCLTPLCCGAGGCSPPCSR